MTEQGGLQGIHKDIKVQKFLEDQDLSSPFRMTVLSKSQFVKKMQKAMNDENKIFMEKEELELLYDRAEKIKRKANHLYFTLKTTLGSKNYQELKAKTIGNQIEDTFKEWPSYEEIFGNQDYVTGDSYRSILGMAAYFVDLMRVTDVYVTKVNQQIPEGMSIEERRPDLFDLPLDEKNTDEMVPYLKIINERLTEKIKKVVETENPHKMFASMKYPINLPVNLPMEGIHSMMSQADVSLADIYEIVGKDQKAAVFERIGIDKNHVEMFSSPFHEAELCPWYGVSDVSELEKFHKVPTFMTVCDISRSQLQELLFQDLKAGEEETAAGFFINQGLPENQYMEIKEDIIVNMNVDALERINRFLRISGIFSLSYGDMDWIIRSLSDGRTLDEKCMEQMAQIILLQEPLALKLRELAGFFCQMCTYGEENIYEDVYCKGDISYHPKGAFNKAYQDELKTWNVEKDEDITKWLCGSLNLDNQKLLLLIGQIFGETEILLTMETLSVLYGHKTIAKKLSMDMKEYTLLLSLLGVKGKLQPEHVKKVIEVKEQWDDVGINAYDADFFVNGNQSPYIKIRYTKESFNQWLKVLWNQSFVGEEEERKKVVTAALAEFFATEETTICCFSKTFKEFEENEAWYDMFLKKPEQEGEPSPYEAELEKIFQIINQWMNLCDHKVPEVLIESIGIQKEAYGFQSFEKMTLTDLLSICNMCKNFKDFNDDTYELLQCMKMDEESLEKLASIIGCTLADIQMVLKDFEGTSVDKLDILKRYMVLIKKAGFHYDYLQSLAQLKDFEVSDYDKTEEVRKNAENMFGSSLRNKQQTMLTWDRDCMVKILCWKQSMDVDQIYQYFLMDVEMDEKTEVSYIREGINALQLYLQRCRMGLEPGIKNIEFEPEWWDYMLDYSMWKANRQIYLYPENYLIPSIRHTKTDAFAKVESGLNQSNLTEDYLEGLYSDYLEDFSKVMDVKICSAYKTGNTTYLFGRTRQQPYIYYYCTQEQYPVWGQWKELKGCTISAEDVTPAVVFGKLHVFWVEQKKLKSNMIHGSESMEGTSWRADVKYTFLNSKGQWAPPQDLISDELFYYEEEGKSLQDSSNLFNNVFHMESDLWKKVRVIPINGDNYKSFENKTADFQKVMILFGSYLNLIEGKAQESIINPYQGSDGKVFCEKLLASAQNYNRMLKGGGNGYVTAGFAKVYNSNFQEDSLVRKNEFLVLDEYRYQKGGLGLVPAMAGLDGNFGAMNTGHTLADLYGEMNRSLMKEPEAMDAQAFITEGINEEDSNKIFNLLCEKEIIYRNSRYEPMTVQKKELSENDLKEMFLTQGAPLDGKPQMLLKLEAMLTGYLKGTILFPQGVSSDARVRPVCNCPRAFMICDGEETFLFSMKKGEVSDLYLDIDKGITVSYPQADALLFQNAGIEKKQAVDVIAKLQQEGIINEKYITDLAACTMEHLEEVLEETGVDISLVYSVLQNDPIVSKDLFVSDDLGINRELSEKIYQKFADEGVIVDGRVRLAQLYETPPRTMLSDFLENGSIDGTKIQDIYDLLLYTPVPISIKYWNQEGADSDKVTYEVCRLSNGIGMKLQTKFMGNGLKGLLETDSQNHPLVSVLPFERYGMAESGLYDLPKETEGTGADFEGLYGEYFWELFYHIPMLASDTLKSSNGFEAGKRWMEYVFQPLNQPALIRTDTFHQKDPQHFTMQQSEAVAKALREHQVIDQEGRVKEDFSKDLTYLEQIIPETSVEIVLHVLENSLTVPEYAYYWNFFPFRNYTLERMLEVLDDNNPAMVIYNDDPFDPHAVARIHMGSYEKYTMLQYIDNLLLWGDMEFTKNTWESLTAASMYYMLASELLGNRPQNKGYAKEIQVLTFRQIQEANPHIPQFLIDLAAMLENEDDEKKMELKTPYIDDSKYFAVPENDKMEEYWDRLDDRLYKIRNSMDINGLPRQTELYGVDINPMEAARVSYTAQGSQTPKSYSVSTPYPYKFTFLIEQAKAMVNQLISSETQLLGLLEKNDAETFQYMLGTQEKILLGLTTTVKEKQVEELEKNKTAMAASLQGAQERQQYYSGLIAGGISEKERESLDSADTAFIMSTAANILKMSAGAAHAVPQVGSPFAMTYGGIQVGAVIDSIAGGMELGASIANFVSSRASTMAGYERREQDWIIQKKNAENEISNLNEQIQGAAIRIESAQRELEIQNQTAQQKQEVLEYMSSKFTSASLYQWMCGQMNQIIWQTYQIALELSVQAEAAYQYETDKKDTFLTCQYFDNAKKGLLSGENLLLSLEQMQNAYLKNDTRSFEVERHVSLALECPEAFLQLKSKGSCTFCLTEKMFDYDYPGMYQRKIKSISLSIPAVTGPYQTLKAVLTQTGNALITEPDLKGVQYLLEKEREGRGGDVPSSVKENQRINGKIALSGGIDDSGIFQLNMEDTRYLPYEGTGAISSWRLDMPKYTNRFDFRTITDVLVHVRYCAEMDGKLQTEVEQELAAYPARGSLYYHLKQNFGSQWNQFMEDHEDPNAQTLCFSMDPREMYYENMKLESVCLKLDLSEELPDGLSYEGITLTLGDIAVPVSMQKDVGQATLDLEFEKCRQLWKIKVDLKVLRENSKLKFLLKDGFLDADKWKDMELLLVYSGTFNK